MITCTRIQGSTAIDNAASRRRKCEPLETLRKRDCMASLPSLGFMPYRTHCYQVRRPSNKNRGGVFDREESL